MRSSISKAIDQDNNEFCLLDNDSDSGVYVDLIENPERFTGYSGHASRRVWRSVYEENCFSSSSRSSSPFSKHQWNKCLERKVFYRAISGILISQTNI